MSLSRGSDVLILGGGIAGLSLASQLATRAQVTLLEAEDAVGFHASGRSATMLHYALGDSLVRALTQASRTFFDAPPAGFADAPLGQRTPVLVHAKAEEADQLDALHHAIAPFADLERLDAAGVQALCPVVRAEFGLADHDGLRLDPHALLQGHLRLFRSQDGRLVTAARAVRIERTGERWRVVTERAGRFEADILVNAAGAWADAVAGIAGVEPIGLQPLRRTIITFDPPAAVDVSSWPFARTVTEELYIAPEAGRLLASPMDEVASAPCDAQPDEQEVALAAWRVEERTTMRVDRIRSRWAGLRTIAPDRHPVVGFDPTAPGFLWLAGQGGFGLQTSPALASAAASLITGEAWPLAAVTPEALSPCRLRS